MTTEKDGLKKQLHAEAYGMGDVKVGQTITGRYPNQPAIQNLRATKPGTPERARADAVMDAHREFFMMVYREAALEKVAEFVREVWEAEKAHRGR